MDAIAKMSKKLDDLIRAAETVVELWSDAKIIAEEGYPECELDLSALATALNDYHAEIALGRG